jgi:hypothetical protein
MCFGSVIDAHEYPWRWTTTSISAGIDGMSFQRRTRSGAFPR